MYRKIRFVDMPSEVPVVKFYLGDGTCGFAIVDTGSELTTFDADFVKEHKKQFRVSMTKDKISMIGLGSETEQHALNTDVVLTMTDTDGSDVCVRIRHGVLFHLEHIRDVLNQQYGIDISVDAIFGSDMLNKYEAKINYKDKTLALEDDIYGKR